MLVKKKSKINKTGTTRQAILLKLLGTRFYCQASQGEISAKLRGKNRFIVLIMVPAPVRLQLVGDDPQAFQRQVRLYGFNGFRDTGDQRGQTTGGDGF